MFAPSASLIVVYTERLAECRAFYTELGLELVHEQHGSGPAHVAATLAGGTVLEVPARGGRAPATDGDGGPGGGERA